MKKILAVIAVLVLLLSGCENKDASMDQALSLREQLQQKECSFYVEITADYGDEVYEFGMDCQADTVGNLTFLVSSPESIQGIAGTVDGKGGKLTFDDTVLSFAMLADGQITPVSAPWILIRTLRAGYIHASTETQTGYKLIIHDSYEEDSLQLDIWLDTEGLPVSAEILWQGRRILSLCVNNFVFV